MNAPRTRKRNREVLEEVLSQINPNEKARTEQRMALAVQISDALSHRGYTKSKFAEMMGKEPSEVSKWLSGTHNFTTNTLTDIGRVLGVNFFTTEVQKPTVEIQYLPVVVQVPVNKPSNRVGSFVHSKGTHTSVISVFENCN